MMQTKSRISLLLNLLFIVTLFIFALYLSFRFTEPFYSKFIDDKSRVESGIVISELQECINKYYEYMYFGEYEKAKYSTSILSRKSKTDYEKKAEEIKKYGEFEVIVKYAYKLYGDTYRCYVFMHDKKSGDTSYIINEDKDNMVQIVISLDRITNNFSIVSDSTFEPGGKNG